MTKESSTTVTGYGGVGIALSKRAVHSGPLALASTPPQTVTAAAAAAADSTGPTVVAGTQPATAQKSIHPAMT